jgi:hypothetical protein
MKLLRTAVLAGAASLALAGAAVAADQRTHVMNVALPDGMVAHIRYQGDVAPLVKLVPSSDQRSMPVAMIDPLALWAGDPFSRMDAIFAQMERQHAALMRQAASIMQSGGNGLVSAPSGGATDAAPGAYSFTVVSSTSGGGTCGRSVEVTSQPNAAPRTVSRTFGNCEGKDAPAPAAPAHAAPMRPSVPTV